MTAPPLTLYPDRTLQPFEVITYDPTFTRTGYVGGYNMLTATPRFNDIGTCQIDLRLDHPSIPRLMADATRAVVNYDGAFLMSGRIRTQGATGPSKQGVMSFGIQSDFIILSRILGFPNPTGAITDQGATTRVHTEIGPAETVAKNLIRLALNRIGSTLVPITIAADLGRGPSIRIDTRMDILADKLFPAMTDAGVGITVEQHGAGLVIDCFLPTTRPRVLTEESGALKSWTWTREVQTATRAVVAGAGTGTDREYRYVVDTTTETALHEWSEIFVDANDIGGPYEAAIADVPKKLTASINAQAAANRAEDAYDVAVNTEDARADDLSAAQDAVADANDAVANAPSTGAQHDRAVAALARANTTQARATTKHTAAVTALAAKTTADTAAQAAAVTAATAYTTAVALSLSLRTAYNADMIARGMSVIAGTANLGTVSIILQENAVNRYGRTLSVGDLVNVNVPPGVPLLQICGSCTFTHDRSGLLVEPALGVFKATALSKTISALNRLSKQVKFIVTGK